MPLLRIARLYRDAYTGHSRGVWVMSTCMFISRCGRMVVPFLSLYLTGSLHYSEQQAGRFISTYGVGCLVGSYIAGKLVDTYSAVRVQVTMMLISAPICILVPFCTQTWSLVCAVLFLGLFCEGIRPANATAIAKLSDPGKQARSFALQRTFINCGMSLGPAVGGVLATYSFKLIFICEATLNTSCAIFMWYMLGLDKIVSPETSVRSKSADELAAESDRAQGISDGDKQTLADQGRKVSNQNSTRVGKSPQNATTEIKEGNTESRNVAEDHTQHTAKASQDSTTPDDQSDAERVERVASRTSVMLAEDRKPLNDPIFMAVVSLNFITYLGMFQLFTTLPLYARDTYGFTKSQTGAMFSMNTVLVILFEMVLTTWSQTLDPMLTVGAGSFMILWAFGILVFVHQPFIIYVCCITMTLGQMVSTSITAGFVADRSVGKHQGEYMGVKAITDSLGFVLAPAVGTYIYSIDHEMLWYCCLAAGVVVALGYIGLAVILRRSNRRNEATARETTALLS